MTSLMIHSLTSPCVPLASCLHQANVCTHRQERGHPCPPIAPPSLHFDFSQMMTGSGWRVWRWRGALCCCTPRVHAESSHLMFQFIRNVYSIVLSFNSITHQSNDKDLAEAVGHRRELSELQRWLVVIGFIIIIRAQVTVAIWSGCWKHSRQH